MISELAQFMLADKGQISDATLTCRAILVYATFMATNYYRSHGRTSTTVAVDAMGQYCRSATCGHPKSMEILDGLWTTSLFLI